MKKTILLGGGAVLFGAPLCLARLSGIHVHIALAAAVLVLLVLHTVLMHRTWHAPALEILLLVLFGVATVSGGLLLLWPAQMLLALHRTSGTAFVLAQVLLLVGRVFAHPTSDADGTENG